MRHATRPPPTFAPLRCQVDCDQSTRAWFRDNLQLEQADAQGYPSDQVRLALGA